MKKSKIEKRLNFLTYYAGALTLFLLVFIFGAFTEPDKKSFEVIEAERINIVEPNGQLAMVLANTKRLPGAIINGRVNYDRKHLAGILFFNGIGDETGGLLFGSWKTKDGVQKQGVHLSFDSFKDNQVLVLNHMKTGDSTATKFRFIDRPSSFGWAKIAKKAWVTRNGTSKEQKQAEQWLQEHYDEYSKKTVDRIVIGSFDRLSKIQLNDTKGQPRIRLVIDSTNTPRLEFLDTKGNVIYSLPPKTN